jgi:hypothetical protein
MRSAREVQIVGEPVLADQEAHELLGQGHMPARFEDGS